MEVPPGKVGRNTVTSGVFDTVTVTEPIPYYRRKQGPLRAYSLCAWPAVTNGDPGTVPGNEPLLPFPKTKYTHPCLWECTDFFGG